MLPETNLATSQWLKDNLEDPKLIILYTNMDNPVTGQTDDKPVAFIPKSLFFDFENVFCDVDSSLPHTMPSQDCFNEEAIKLGINTDSIIVVYDNKGIYCAPRVWWMFKAMGHEQVYVLDGGLPVWLNQGLPTQPQLISATKVGDFKGRFNNRCFTNADEINKEPTNFTLLDARNEGRFNGTQAEPREGLRSGHIPNSINLPFDQCLDSTRLKPLEELKQIFAKLLLEPNKPLIFSCGSGVTACILALAATQAGYTETSVYDGSWSEWGARLELPVEL